MGKNLDIASTSTDPKKLRQLQKFARRSGQTTVADAAAKQLKKIKGGPAV